MNKKSQIQQHSAGAHPVLYLGIFIFVIPFLSPILHMKLPGWISAVGVAVILLGAGLSVMRTV